MHLPFNSAVESGVGLGTTTSVARKVAAMDAVIRLHKARELDDHLSFVAGKAAKRRRRQQLASTNEEGGISAKPEYVIRVHVHSYHQATQTAGTPATSHSDVAH